MTERPAGDFTRAVCLFHETLHGCRFNNRRVAESERFTPKYLKSLCATLGVPCAVMLGDIHMRQQFELSASATAAYAGSMVCQDFGESHLRHGWLDWALAGGRWVSTPRDIPNPRAMYTATVRRGADVTQHPPENPQAYKVEHIDTSPEDLRKAVDALIAKHGFEPRDVTELNGSVSEAADAVGPKVESGGPGEAEREVAIMEQVLRREPEGVRRAVIDMHRAARPRAAERSRANLLRLTFSNMYSYGPGNLLDFERLRRATPGIIGVIAPNEAGKSALLDIIGYAVTGCAFRGAKSNIARRGPDGDPYPCQLRLAFERDGQRGIFDMQKEAQEIHPRVDLELGGESLVERDATETTQQQQALLGSFAHLNHVVMCREPGFSRMDVKKRKECLASLLQLGFYEGAKADNERQLAELRATLKANYTALCAIFPSIGSNAGPIQYRARAMLNSPLFRAAEDPPDPERVRALRRECAVVTQDIEEFEAERVKVGVATHDDEELKSCTRQELEAAARTRSTKTLEVLRNTLVLMDQRAASHPDIDVADRELAAASEEAALAEAALARLPPGVPHDPKRDIPKPKGVPSAALRAELLDMRAIIGAPPDGADEKVDANLVFESVRRLCDLHAAALWAPEKMRAHLVGNLARGLDGDEAVAEARRLARIEMQGEEAHLRELLRLWPAQARTQALRAAARQKLLQLQAEELREWKEREAQGVRAEQLTAARGRARKKLEAVRERVAGSERACVLADIRAHNAAIELEGRDQEQARESIDVAQARAEARLAAVQASYESLKRRGDRIANVQLHAGLIAEMRKAMGEIDVRVAYRKVLDPQKGLAAHLLRSAEQRVAATTNRHLAAAAAKFRISLKGGVLSLQGVAERVVNPDPALATGYQSFLLELAVRAALHEAAHVPLPNLLMIDEGFGALDSENLPQVGAALHALALTFPGPIITVTHREEMRPFLAQTVDILVEAGASQLGAREAPAVNFARAERRGPYLMVGGTCSCCQTSVKSWARHVASKKHRAFMSPSLEERNDEEVYCRACKRTVKRTSWVLHLETKAHQSLCRDVAA
ncbi:MAG: AAA family ATPase [Sulfitobacter sp.]|nr:AAA family ATPase [Sulfitobacter sp.]